MVTNSLLRIEFIKVVNTEILVGLVSAEHEINSHEQPVLDCADGALFSTPPRQTMGLRLEIAVFGTHRRVGHLGQNRVEVTVGSGGFTAAPFAGAFMVAGTLARPRGKVFVSGESTHVGPGFRQQRPRPTLADPRNRVKLFDRGTKRRGRYRSQPLAHACDLLFEKVVLSKQLAQQKAVMIVELSLQRALQLGNLVAQLTLGQLRQHRYVFLPGYQRFNHLASRHPQHITGHRAQFDVGGLQHFLDAVVDRISLLHQLGLLAGQIPKLALLTVRDKTRPEQPTLHQLRYPLRVLHVGLSPRHLLDVLRIDHPRFEMSFEQIEHRLPVHPRRLHRHMRHPRLGQPLAQLYQIRRHCAELPQRALHRAILSIKDAHARHYHFLVHVQPTHTRIQRPQPRNATLLLAHRPSPFLAACPGDIRLIRFSFACSRRQTTRRQSEAPKDVPDHTLRRALSLQSLIDLFAGPPPSYYPNPPPFSFSVGERKIMNHSAVKSTSRLKLVPFLIKIISTEDNRARARNAPLPDGAALQGGLRACRAPFARAAAARPSPKGLDLCSLREHGKNQ